MPRSSLPNTTNETTAPSYELNVHASNHNLLANKGVDFNIMNRDSNNTLLRQVMLDFGSLPPVFTMLRERTFYTSDLEAQFDSRSRFVKNLANLTVLLNNGVDLNACSNSGDTPVHVFMRHVCPHYLEGGYARILDKCISKGFKINTPGEHGRTILHIAASHHNMIAVKYLLARKADINARDEYGRTPLHYAACDPLALESWTSPAIAVLLIERGANADLPDHRDLTALGRAQHMFSELKKTEAFRDWVGDRGKIAWTNEIKHLESAMTDTIIKFREAKHPKGREALPDTTNRVMSWLHPNGVYTVETKQYINSFKNKIPNTMIIQDFKISNEDFELLQFYFDDITSQCINIPVILNERVYDLNTLLHILKVDKLDPYNQDPFKLSDIRPAYQMANEIFVVMKMLIAKYEPKAIQAVGNGVRNIPDGLYGVPSAYNRVGWPSMIEMKTDEGEEKSNQRDYIIC